MSCRCVLWSLKTTKTALLLPQTRQLQSEQLIRFRNFILYLFGECPRRTCYQEETSQHSESSRQGISMSGPIIDEMSLLSPFQTWYSQQSWTPAQPALRQQPVHPCPLTLAAAWSGAARPADRAASARSRRWEEVNYNFQHLWWWLLLQVFFLLIINQHTFEIVHSYTFIPFEYAISIMSNHYYVVGTGIIQREESEPKAGGVQLGIREAYAGQLTWDIVCASYPYFVKLHRKDVRRRIKQYKNADQSRKETSSKVKFIV